MYMHTYINGIVAVLIRSYLVRVASFLVRRATAERRRCGDIKSQHGIVVQPTAKPETGVCA